MVGTQTMIDNPTQWLTYYTQTMVDTIHSTKVDTRNTHRQWLTHYTPAIVDITHRQSLTYYTPAMVTTLKIVAI